jgi:hypothetical protein
MSETTTTYEPRDKDVVRYETLTRPNRWCREGIAIAEQRGSGAIYLLDTYWGHHTSETHVLSDPEIATAELLFNLDDYDELDKYSSGSKLKWERYAPADRRIVTEQHGCYTRWFVRKGAVESWPTKIENAQRELDKKREDLKHAQWHVEWAEQELARVIADAEAAQP